MSEICIKYYKLNGNLLHNGKRTIVEEFPVKLIINNKELLTISASPHQLNYLIIGFLHLQGLIEQISDIETFGLCTDSGIATVKIKGVVPDNLMPTLTSGCGRGVSYNLPSTFKPKESEQFQREPFKAAAILHLMNSLMHKAERYRQHGGIHSAAVGDNTKLWIYTEDLGRHNTIDRIAGEALIRDIDLSGTALVVSGRVSTELVAKCIRLGVGLIATRTSPTDLAIKMCQQAGIILIGYLKGSSFEIYTYSERIQLG